VRNPMEDLLLIGIVIAFFLASWAYTAGCDRI
jgi:hypothetical protein